MNKKQIKNIMIEKRQSYSVIQRSPWDKIIHDSIIPMLEPHKTIAIYASFNGEVDTYGIIETLLWSKHRIVLPRIENKTMNFYEIDNFHDLRKSSYGILEPVSETIVPAEMIDIMVVPLVAFNRKCYRVGYGGGYYDRYTVHTHFPKIGLAYSFQETSVPFQEDHDIALDVIVTEKEVIYDSEK